ncbi:hypothetical protein ANRL2_01460 [Anaerolineae bacterium]|nr:hypothetical protein ANRL2_01460 [Anaerolineae bacterium]
MKTRYLSVVPFVLLSVNAAQAGAPESLPPVNEAASYSNVDIAGNHTSKEVFSHFSSECAGGKLLFLAPLKDGRFVRLTLLKSPEAAAYVDTDGDSKYPWLLACEGPARFLVEKEHQYSPGAARFRLYKGRALEGIDYAMNNTNTGTAPASAAGGIDDEAFAWKMASELAAIKMDFVSTNQGTRFAGRHESSVDGCDTVSVRRLEGDDSFRRYKVCSGSGSPQLLASSGSWKSVASIRRIP